MAALRQQGQLSTHECSLEACVEGSIGYVGETPAPLVLLPLEDAIGELEQPNLPGPGDVHPNWRRRWPVAAAELLDQPQAQRHLDRLVESRGIERGPAHD
ncbi:hypothetical protein D3C76_1631570 [compost metagenome]